MSKRYTREEFEAFWKFQIDGLRDYIAQKKADGTFPPQKKWEAEGFDADDDGPRMLSDFDRRGMRYDESEVDYRLK